MTHPNPPPENLSEVLEALAANQPAAPLLHLPGRPSLTYGDLGAQIRDVRRCLRGWGVAPGDVIVGCIDSRPQMALACAALPSSSTFAPLSSALTEAGYATLLERLRPKAVLVEAGRDHPLRAAAARSGIVEIRLDPDPDAPFGRFRLERSGSGPLGSAHAGTRPQHAYVLHTSGTTGRAKLVPVGHRQMLTFARTLADLLRYGPEDVGCSLSPFHLAGGLRATLLIPILNGGSVVCLPEADVEGFFRAIDEFRLTNLAAGFAIHRAILRRSPDFRDEVARSRMRFLRATAGRIEPDEVDRLEAVFRAPLVVGFGSTEAGAIAHDPLPPRPRKRGAVGVPTINDVAVMDGDGGFCGAGATGEIVVRGPLVFDGYLDDPDLTARSFVGDWFRTGDLGRIDADGYVFVSGRIKEMINRGGEKISPVQIDSALESCVGVAEAAAFGVPHPSLGEELVAAVVREANVAIDEADIIDHVRRRLGPRQLPRRIHFLERLPRTESGKVQRSVLTREFGSDGHGTTGVGSTAASSVASALEAGLTRLWSTLFRDRAVGRHDDFFLLGGDSFSGTQLLARVNAEFGTELTLKALLEEAATIAGMARTIERGRGAAPRPSSGLPGAPQAPAG